MTVTLKLNIKKLTAVVFAACMLLAVCLSAASCDAEGITGYTQLRDHVNESSADGGSVRISASDAYCQVTISPERDGQMLVRALTIDNGTYYYTVELILKNDTLICDANFSITYMEVSPMVAADFKVNADMYTGFDTLAFESSDVPAVSDLSCRQIATGLLNTLLLELDTYCQKNVSVSIEALGFTSLAETYRYTPADTAPEADLGGAFSPARLAYAGRMTVVGLGMVFAVLALLWLVLTVFFRQKKEKPTAPKQEAPAPVAPPAPVSETLVNDGVDGATVAAITAAISAMIESDPALKSQFAGGFRVVSFRRVGSRANGAKGAWNR